MIVVKFRLFSLLHFVKHAGNRSHSVYKNLHTFLIVHKKQTNIWLTGAELRTRCYKN